MNKAHAYHASCLTHCISLWWHGVEGNSSYTLQHALTLLPYKLLYASQLAEHGLISEAAQYCGAIQQAMGAVPKLPPGLSVCNTFTKDLLDRLQSYAAVSFLLMQMCLTSCMYLGCPSVVVTLLQHCLLKVAQRFAELCTSLRTSHMLIPLESLPST